MVAPLGWAAASRRRSVLRGVALVASPPPPPTHHLESCERRPGTRHPHLLAAAACRQPPATLALGSAARAAAVLVATELTGHEERSPGCSSLLARSQAPREWGEHLGVLLQKRLHGPSPHARLRLSNATRHDSWKAMLQLLVSTWYCVLSPRLSRRGIVRDPRG